MADGLRTVRVLSTDEALLAAIHTGVDTIDGWSVVQLRDAEALIASPPVAGDVVLVDSWLRGTNVYELMRSLTGRLQARAFVVVEQGNSDAKGIAQFCGAAGILERPVRPSALRQVLEVAAPTPAPMLAKRGEENAYDLPESLLTDLTSGEPDSSMIRALIDPATGLFNYAFLNYKLDEEFKRARRFDHPLAVVMLGFEGQATDEVLRELSGIFLASSRDTDVLGRFDESSFLFLLPNTGPDGAEIMAHRVARDAATRKLKDLVGDPLTLSTGIASYPAPGFERREDLYGKAREAFFAARHKGGGVVIG
ncbi:MAG: diguanylate cyclase (GGDEF)-like protein [Planctomycetota bacterium]|jgi:diguanylate cyclase (GGDEF)-like protein